MPRRYPIPGAYLVGKRVGMLRAIGLLNTVAPRGMQILCACDCGGSISVGIDSFRHNRPHHCGCSYDPNLVDKTNVRFGYLLALQPIGKNKWKEVLWECRCDCGKMAICVAGRLAQGQVTHCGCMTKRNRLLARPRTHCMTESRLYRAWSAMHDRCRNPHLYHGAMGVKVCPEWIKFENFLDWATTHGYQDDLSLDRYPDPFGDYCPENCRWATREQQQRNRRNTKMYSWLGKCQSAPDWADECGLARRLVTGRLRYGWSLEEALTTPPDTRNAFIRPRASLKGI